MKLTYKEMKEKPLTMSEEIITAVETMYPSPQPEETEWEARARLGEVPFNEPEEWLKEFNNNYPKLFVENDDWNWQPDIVNFIKTEIRKAEESCQKGVLAEKWEVANHAYNQAITDAVEVVKSIDYAHYLEALKK